jgi:site-specific recombinase XerD
LAISVRKQLSAFSHFLPSRSAIKNTPEAYYRAIGRFLDWCQRGGFRHLEDIEPIHVDAYIESHQGSPATVKQHMSAIRMVFSWLTEKGILAINPAREVATPRFSRTQGKTPAFATDDTQGAGFDRYHRRHRPERLCRWPRVARVHPGRKQNRGQCCHKTSLH